MEKLFAFTIDLEADYSGLTDEYNILRDLSKIDELLGALDSLGVKITVYVVGDLLEKYPDVIEIFQKYNSEFEPHSYSHSFEYPDSEDEIARAKKAYIRHFNKEPKGYRAPRGKISDEGINRLEKHGFAYDSSVFPSFFPDPFKYLLKDKAPHYYGKSNVLEIPFTSVSPFRLTLSISYIKLLGLGLYKSVSLPNAVCFGSHLHDFIYKEASFSKLPLIWRAIYSRNKHKGTDYCVKFMEHVKERGYKFCYMSDIYNLYKNQV